MWFIYIYTFACAIYTYSREKGKKRPRWMNNSNRADPDNSARHVDSAVSDVFNKTVITVCTILFNRSSRIASHSSFICSLCFFPLASTCWRTTRLLRHTCTQCLRFSSGLTQTVGKLDTKIGNIFLLELHLCRFHTMGKRKGMFDWIENLLKHSTYYGYRSTLFFHQ